MCECVNVFCLSVCLSACLSIRLCFDDVLRVATMQCAVRGLREHQGVLCLSHTHTHTHTHTHHTTRTHAHTHTHTPSHTVVHAHMSLTQLNINSIRLLYSTGLFYLTRLLYSTRLLNAVLPAQRNSTIMSSHLNSAR